MENDYAPRVFVGDKSVFHAIFEEEDPLKTSFDILIHYLSFSQSRIILPPKDYEEIKDGFGDDREKRNWFTAYFKKGDDIGEGNTTVEQDIISLLEVYDLEPAKLYFISKDTTSEEFTKKIKEKSLDIGISTIERIADILTVEEPKFFSYIRNKYFTGSY